MTPNPQGHRTASRDVLRGVLMIALFRRQGLALFGDGARDVSSSLAPLVAFPLVLGLVLVANGADAHDLAEVVLLLDVLLTQLVVSEALASIWGRRAQWLRYAVAANWGQWAMLPATLAFAFASSLLLALGLPIGLVAPLSYVALVAYALALQWFLARYGLELSAWRATALVALVSLATVIITTVPLLAQQAISP